MASTPNDPAGASTQTDVHARLEALFGESPVAIGFSRDGVMLDANPAYARLFGYADASELRGRPILEQIAPSHRPRIAEIVAQRARGERAPERYLSRGLRKDGSEFPFDITTRRVLVADGPLTIAFLTDVSDRELAIDAVKASEEKFRTLSDAAIEAVFVHADGRVLLANASAATLYGFEAPEMMVGVPLMNLTAPESRDIVGSQIRRASSEPYEGVARRTDGSTFVAEVRGRTLLHQGNPARVTIIRDITERLRVEAEQRALAERVRQTQKLESLGLLAGGVAHDFNNLLTVITNEAALVKRDPGLASSTLARLAAITLAAERAADLCRQMMAYTGKTVLSREIVDLNALVLEMASMLEVSMAKKVSLVRDLWAGLPMTLGDPTQLRQIVMNLVINASEAIQGLSGTVSIATGCGIYGAEAFARSAAGGEPKAGTYVWLEVRDDGVGMDATTVVQMFDPFFTTKFVGRGLGMAAVLGIMRGHAGAIEVDSTRGVGTRIRVFFPASEAKQPSEIPTTADLARGHGTVLLVDDEDAVRLSTQFLLEDLGYQVIAVRGGPEAIDAARSTHIDAAVIDLTMPGMDGIQTMRALRRITPRLPVVLSSGYGVNQIEDAHGHEDTPDGILTKPFTSDQLLAAISQAMHITT